MSTLRDEIKAILARTADDIVEAVLRQLGAGTAVPSSPPRAAANGSSRRRRARLSEDELGEAVKDFVRFVRGRGDEGAARADLTAKFGWDAGTFNRIKAAAMAQGEIRQKGDKRVARYIAK